MVDDACLFEYWDRELYYGAHLCYVGDDAEYEEYEEYHEAVIKVNPLGKVCWFVDDAIWEHAPSVKELFAQSDGALVVCDWKLVPALLFRENARQLRLFDSRGHVLCNRI